MDQTGLVRGGPAVAGAHLIVERIPASLSAAHGLDAVAPHLAVVLLEDAARRKRQNLRPARDFDDLGWRLFFDHAPGIDLHAVRAARMPDAHGQKAQERQHREVRKDGADLHAADECALRRRQPPFGRGLHGVQMGDQGGRCAGVHFDLEVDPAVAAVELRLEVAHPRLVPLIAAAFAGAEADLDHGSVRGTRVVVVAVELLRGQLPVAAQFPAMRAGQDHHAGLGLVEDQVEIPLHVAEIIVQADGVLVETGEDEPAERLDARHLDQPPLLAFEFAVIGFPELRHADQPTAIVVRPAVVGTRERLGIAAVQATQARPAVPAGVEEDAQPSVRVAQHEHGFFAHGVRHEVARIGQLRVVRDVQPAAAEDACLFVFVHARIHERARADGPAFEIDEMRPVRPVGHRADSVFRPAGYAGC